MKDGFDSKYDSVYTIFEHESFGNLLRNLLFINLQITDFTDDSVKSLMKLPVRELSNIGIKMFANKVHYVEEKVYHSDKPEHQEQIVKKYLFSKEKKVVVQNV